MKLSKTDKHGLTVLLFLLLGAVAIFHIRRSREGLLSDGTLTEATRNNIRELDSLWKAQDASARDAAPDRYHDDPLFPFDPNTADSATLVALGLRPWQVGNMMKYRRKGGRWRDERHFARLYGLTRTQFERLRPYLRFTPEEMAADVYGITAAPSEKADSLRAKRQPKLPEGSVIDANAADTAELKQIPGIGSYYARCIVEYRERLGGYLYPEQIEEAHGNLPADIARWFVVRQSVPVRKLNVNRATFKQLVRHPYLNYEQVKEIFSYRQTDGDLRGWKDLRFSKHFTSADFERLDPYFDF